MVDEPHMDVSRSSRSAEDRYLNSKSKMDSGLRRNDERRWIPAFAGMTTNEGPGFRRNDGRGARFPLPRERQKNRFALPQEQRSQKKTDGKSRPFSTAR